MIEQRNIGIGNQIQYREVLLTAILGMKPQILGLFEVMLFSIFFNANLAVAKEVSKKY